MTRSNLFIILILILLEGCTDNKTELKEILVEKFPMTKNLGSDATGIKTLSKGNINILVVDTLLIIQKSTEPFLEIYSTNTNRLLTTYGEYGEGPGKIMNPIMSKGIKRNNESSLIIVYDETKRLINKINIKNLINNKVPILMQYPLPFTS